MKIPFLPLHIITTKTLENIAGEIIKNCDGISSIESEGRKRYQLTAAEIAVLMNNSIEMERKLARYGVAAPKLGARIKAH